ncbi:endoribonuclease Dicer-like [Chelonus insularis]|uniref:endoribonuclease Dicer-like n=1 Tax=Chelonus insularis TaxID=460826 RepID=UPI00158B817D|nr:endoribonuclease Dicer-like [Chelonus insularis]
MTLLKYWQEESPENKKKVGEPGNKRSYDIIYPKAFQNAFPSSDEDIYLHIIEAKPMYPVPTENRDRVLYNLFKSSSSFAILSSKKIPKLPEFSIYMKMGRVNVKLQTNFKCLKLSSEEIQELRHFHWLIFKDILSLLKEFMIFDSQSKENNFLIVPTDKDGELNWSVIRNYKSLEKVYPRNIPQNAITNGIDDVILENYSDWELVSPNYRSATNIYVVTRVCHDLNPQSTFPTDDYICYSHYFHEKHKIEISNMTQPLLEVKPISDKINFIKKRAPISPNKRKRDNLEEHLIPELCCKINFPAIYYLKAQTLPSILHRINQLLIAEELRQQIATEAQLGSISASEDQDSWETLHFSDDEIPSDEEATNENIDDTDEYGTHIEDILDETDDHDTVKEDTKIEADINILSLNKNVYRWTSMKEPRDLERNISAIKLIDIEYYNCFQHSLYSLTESANNRKEFCTRQPVVKIPSLTIINKTTGKQPSAANLLPALIVKRANDSINLERLETLGDSFLKFIISLYLFEQYAYQPEGRLTGYKGKIIGNRYLYYCGVNKGIPGRLKVEDFVSKSNFISPSFCTPQEIQQMIRSQNKSPSVLYEVNIPQSEQFQGIISDETRNEFLNKISSWINPTGSTGVEHFINIQNIPDKTIADSVEAIIGVYLKNMNLLGASKLLQWFGIIPNQVNVEQILFGTPKSAALNVGDINIYMNWVDHIEEVLGYKFRDRTFLLQAFTHASYSPNKITLSYDRLEFLGDAVIDFLITVYIYENCNNLNPGELTDLRSALVNNITFGCLTVKYKLNTALLSYTPTLFESIDNFVKFQEHRNYVVDDELLRILLEEDDCDVAEYVDVPKVLGDIFESVIGAVYLDSGKDLTRTWSVLYSLMHDEINKFSKKVPKQAIRVLYETPGIKPRFSKIKIDENTKKILVTLEIKTLGKYRYFHGFGKTIKLAKVGAAKRALKFLQKCN